MSQFYPDAYSFLMSNEDSRQSFAEVPDTGGMAISGINSESWPEDFAAIAAIPQDQRGAAVQNFYLTKFWQPLQIGGVSDQDTANRVLDECVNAGGKTGIEILQKAANSCGANLTVDGVIGALTLEAVNAIDPERLLAAYRAARVQHYEDIVAANPSDAVYLAQWKARASK